jgi:long-chain acyl-CoA synthetase
MRKNIETLAELIDSFVDEDRHIRAIKVKEPVKRELTFEELYNEILSFSSYLIEIGVSHGDKVAIFSDNRFEWILSDLGCQYIGTIDVPRGINISE